MSESEPSSSAPPPSFPRWIAEGWQAAPPWYRAGAALAVAAGAALSVAKAFTTGITYDEALNWHLFLEPGFRAILTTYDANNHLLNTLLSRLAMEAFGPAEWALRMPALAGRLLFLIAVPLLCAQMLRGWGVRLVALAIIASCPILVDWGTLTRGYSIALAGVAWGMVFGARALLYRQSGMMAATSVALGLAVMAVPVFVNVAAPLCAIVAAGELRRGWRPGLRAAALLVAPAAALNAITWAGILPRLERGQFYMGAPSAVSSFQALHFSLFYYGDPGKGPLRWLTALFLHPAGQVATACVMAAALGWALVQRGALALRLAAGALAGALVLAALQRWLLGFPWPVDRTILYAVPLLWIMAVGAAFAAAPGGRWRLWAWAAVGLLGVYQASKMTLDIHFPYRTSAPVREVMRELREAAASAPEAPRLVHTEWVRWEVAYYSHLYGMEEVEFHVAEELEGGTGPGDWLLVFSHDLARDPALGRVREYPRAGVVLLKR